MKYRAIVEVEMVVEGHPDHIVEYINTNKLHLNISGCGVDCGSYSIATTGNQKIKSIEHYIDTNTEGVL